jgi:multidrug efflux pump subunit AcrB
LLDLNFPPSDSRERMLAALKACQQAVSAVEGVQGSLALTDNPFDRLNDWPCMLVRLAPPGERASSREEVTKTLRTRLNAVKEMELPTRKAQQPPLRRRWTQVNAVKEAAFRVRDLSRPGGFSRWRYPVELALLDRGAIGIVPLSEAATKLAERLRQSSQLVDVSVNPGSLLRPYCSMEVDRNAVTTHGVALEDVMATIYTMPDGRSVRECEQRLLQVKVRDAAGQQVPLSKLVKVREVQGLAAVDRFNMAPAVEITANLAPGVSVGQARTLCEFQARELQRELRMEQAYELIWLQGMPPPE